MKRNHRHGMNAPNAAKNSTSGKANGNYIGAQLLDTGQVTANDHTAEAQQFVT